MQNKVKLILIYLIGAIVLSCNDRTNEDIFYRYYTTNSDSIVLFENSAKQILKDNLFMINDTLYLGLPLLEDEFNESTNSIQAIKKGILLFNTVTYNLPLDTKSYKFLVKDFIAVDSNKVIAFPRGKYKLPFFKVLKLKPNKTIILDKDNTYLKDDSFVYCIPTHSYLKVKPSEFNIKQIDGVTHGEINDTFYYLDEKLK